MSRIFRLKTKLQAPVKVTSETGGWSLRPLDDDYYKLHKIDENDLTEDTIFLTVEQLKCLYTLLTKEE